MRHITGALICICAMALATALGFVGLRMRTVRIEPQAIPPKSSQIVLRVPALAWRWDTLEQSRLVDLLLRSDIFDHIDQADALQFEVDAKLKELRPDNKFFKTPVRTESPVLKLRQALADIEKTSRQVKFDVTDKHHLLDFFGRDVVAGLKFDPDNREILWVAGTEVGGRGYLATQLIAKFCAPANTVGGVTMYQLPNVPSLFFAGIGSTAFAANNIDFLAESLEQAKNPDYDGSLMLPPLTWDTVSARFDIAALRRLKPYQGNVFSSLDNLFMYYNGLLHAGMKEGQGIDWILDTLVFNDCLNVNYVDELVANISLTHSNLDLKFKVEPGRLEADDYIAALRAMPAKAASIAEVLPGNTLAFNMSQMEFPKWIEEIRKETIASSIDTNASASERNRQQQLTEDAWKENWQEFNAAAQPLTLEEDIMPYLGPNYGFAAVWQGAPDNLLPDDIVLPGLIYFIQFQPELEPRVEELAGKAFDRFLKKVDANRDTSAPGYKPIYRGIQSREVQGVTIHELNLDLERSDLTLFAGLEKNLRPGYMILRNMLFIATHTGALDAVANASAGAAPSLRSAVGDKIFDGERNLEAFLQSRILGEYYRATADALAGMDMAGLSEYPEERGQRKEVHLLRSEVFNLLRTIELQAAWQAPDHTLQVQVRFPD